jgi:hypothetical protein
MIWDIFFTLWLFSLMVITIIGWLVAIDCMALDWIITDVIKSKLRKWANKNK